MSLLAPLPGVLRLAEVSALRTAVGFLAAGEADGVPPSKVKLAVETAEKLAEYGLWVGFSRLELPVLWTALENGAEGVMQPSGGFRWEQRVAFRAAANRIADAAGISGPRF